MMIKEEEGENECHSDMNPPNPSSSSSTATNRDASDGFETASDAFIKDSCPIFLYPNNEQQKTPSQNDDYVESKQKAFEEASDVKIEGNRLFGSGQYQEALTQYELALHLAPDMPPSVELRSICHLNSAVCFSKLAKKECCKALYKDKTDKNGERYRRAKQEAKKAVREAKLAAYDDIGIIYPHNDPLIVEAHIANFEVRRILVDTGASVNIMFAEAFGALAEEKREKMKEEMIGKLKEMGNSLLGRFGMSVDNFKSVKDPNTGSYSLSFQR
ncbi:unnamed protein product [Malus baccata var. baccata]